MTLPLIDRVIGRTGIRIHPGNTPADTEGCILVGELANAGTRLIYSKPTFLTLMSLLLEAQQHREEIWIDVVDCLPHTLFQQRTYDAATHRGFDDEWLNQQVVYVYGDESTPLH